MHNEWAPIDRDGWFRNGCSYEYLAKSPRDPIARKRQPKGVVFQNMAYKWVAYIPTWSEDGCSHIKGLGTFRSDFLHKAMEVVEREVLQLNMFSPGRKEQAL